LKPCLFVANLNEEEFRDGPHYTALRKLAAARGVPLVPILGDLEVELADFSPEERGEFLRTWAWRSRASTGGAGIPAAPGPGDLYTIVGVEVRPGRPAGATAPRPPAGCTRT
jgi:hypothetical protein